MKGTIVVIPAFNEARTIREVVTAVRRLDVDRIILVDDGSTDATVTLIRTLDAREDSSPCLELIRHETNLGKGFALASGIARALTCGGRRIVTIDADGQHCADDIPRLERSAMRAPEAIVIAARTEAREAAPPLRRFANEVADFWISWACGRRIDDTQSGFKLYPVAVLARLNVQPRRNAGFAFETELLIDGVAAGAEIRSVPIMTRYLLDRRLSHYRPWRDTWSIVRLVGAKLLRRGLYPTGLLRSLDRASGSAKGGAPALRDID
jgi:glycosyltransferase involved in cell wall biosynthesis